MSASASHRFGWLGVVIVAIAALPAAAQNAFTPGNVVVYRVGGTSTALSTNAAPVFLDEVNPTTGTLVQSIPLSITAIGTGEAGGHGRLTLSPDGQFLAVPGFNAPVGTVNVRATLATSVPRSVQVIGAAGTVVSQTNLSDAFSGRSINSAVTSNGTDIWIGGRAGTGTGQPALGGLRYTTAGSTTSTQLVAQPSAVSNFGVLRIHDGQLYSGFQGGGGVPGGPSTIGTGLPTTGPQTPTTLPGVNNGLSAAPLAFLDLNPAVPGVDTLYIVGNQLTKYSLVGGTWVPASASISYPSGQGSDLTGRVEANGNVTLFMTGFGPSSEPLLFRFTDTTGYNQNFAAGAAFETAYNFNLSNATVNGIAFVPFAPIPEPGSILAVAAGVVGLGGLVRRRLRRTTPAGEADPMATV